MLARRLFALLVLASASACAAIAEDSQLPPSIIELRQYTLHPGQRDVLIDLFEREFIESQEAVGMQILGTFRDLDNPDRFVWIRGFENMTQRRVALAAFYGGPVWRAHREAANATMIDSDNVLLLHPVARTDTMPDRPAPGARETPSSVFIATIYPLPRGLDRDFAAFFERDLKPALERRNVDLITAFATEHSENTFPALPVRDGETVFVTLCRFDTLAAYEAYRRAPDEAFAIQLQRHLIARPEILRLQPTARSLLR
jgi:hypothetical protein